MFYFRMLGGYTVTVDDEPLDPLPTEKSRTLLAYLALHPLPHTRGQLVGLFWPDLPEPQARRRLTQEVWRINSAVGKIGVDRVVITAGNTVALNRVLPIDGDVLRLRTALARLSAADRHDWPNLSELTDLYQGELLPGYFDDWVLVEREQLFQAYANGLTRLLDAQKRLGDWAEAERVVLTLRQHDPFTEEWVAEAMQIALVLRRPETGLRHYERYVAWLQAELAATPGAALTRLAQRLVASSQPVAALSAPAAFVDPAYQPPLIGRDAERARLLHVLEQVQTGRGQLCLIEGEAGMGKSRLLETLVADARWRSLLTGWGAAQEIRRHEPYHPLLQALGAVLSPLRAQQLYVQVDPIWLTTAVRLLPDLAEWLPDLPPLPPLDPEPERIRLLEALTRIVLALGDLTPIILVLDDMQWADSDTLDALIYLSRRVAHSSLLLLLSYRSTEARLDPTIWTALAEIDRGSQPQRLELSGISDEATALLVRTVLDLKRAAPLFEQRIYTQSQGNPFFVLETLRTLYQEGNLTRSADGDWQTPWDTQTVDYREASIVPQVESMIERRLAQLLPEERQVLNAAAVFGTTFDLHLLTSFFPEMPRQVLAATATLVQRRFLQETPTAYCFEHDQIRQAVYGSLTADERRVLHSRAGETLVRLQPDAAARLAHHFEQAGILERAFSYHCQAGDRARCAGSFLLARRHYARLVAWRDRLQLPLATRIEVLLTWERLLDFLGEREVQAEVLSMLTQASGLDQRQQGILALRRAHFEGSAGRFAAAIAATADGFALAEAIADQRLQVEALITWGRLLHEQGDPAAAVPQLQRAVMIATAVDDAHVQAEALIALADVLPACNAYTEALHSAESALERYRALHDLAGEAHANLILAVIQVEQGDVAGAVERYTQALALTEQCGYRLQEVRIANNMANALCILGRIGEALALYERGMTISRDVGDVRREQLIAINYGSTYLSFVGPDITVVERIRRALTWGETSGDAISIGQAWNLLAMDAYYRGDLAEARQYLDQSSAAFTGVEYAYIKAQALRAQSTLCRAEGQLDAALALIEQALAVSRQIEASHLITEMRSIAGEILLGLGRTEAALVATSESAAGADPNVFQSYLVHYRHFKALAAAGCQAEAQSALARAWQEFNALLDSLTPAQRERSRTAIPAHRELLADAAGQLQGTPLCVDTF